MSQRGWPYEKPAAAAHHQQQPTTMVARPAASETAVERLIEHLRSLKGAKQLWEVAVKRNSMTTSLALLGGVLVADTLLYPGSKKAQKALLQANLAAAPAAGGAPASSTSASSSSMGIAGGRPPHAGARA